MASVHDRIIALSMELLDATEMMIITLKDAGYCRDIALTTERTVDGVALIDMLWPEEVE
jgi:hypothetical protein